MCNSGCQSYLNLNCITFHQRCHRRADNSFKMQCLHRQVQICYCSSNGAGKSQCCFNLVSRKAIYLCTIFSKSFVANRRLFTVLSEHVICGCLYTVVDCLNWTRNISKGKYTIGTQPLSSREASINYVRCSGGGDGGWSNRTSPNLTQGKGVVLSNITLIFFPHQTLSNCEKIKFN